MLGPEGFVLYMSEGTRFYWKQLTALNECPCRGDFNEASHRLLGQSLTVDAQPNDWISIRLAFATGSTSSGGEKFKAIFIARNGLTETTALGFLHLLHHMSAEAGSCLESMDLNPSSYAKPNCLRLNLKLGVGLEEKVLENGGDQVHKFPQLRCKKVICGSAVCDGRGHSILSRLFSRCHTVAGLQLPSFGNLQLLLRGIASHNSTMGANNRQCVVRRIEFNYVHTGFCAPGRGMVVLSPGAIDSIIKHFQQQAVIFESCIPHVVFPTAIIPHEEWPSMCPLPESVPRLMVREAREHCYTNELSGEQFRVRLIIEGWYAGACIREFHLLFH